MKRFTVGTFVAALSVVCIATPVQALDGANLTVSLNNGAYPHEYVLTYTCGTSGVIDFAGTGEAGRQDNDGEIITGSLNTVNQTFEFTSQYIRDDNYVYSLSGNITGVSGTVSLVGTSGTGGVQDGTGTFTEVPDCAPSRAFGNHGSYVSGAAKSGVKGAALAEIAKDSTLVGTYAE